MDMMLTNLPIQSPRILFATTHIQKKKKKKKWIVRFLICSLGNRDLKLMKGR